MLYRNRGDGTFERVVLYSKAWSSNSYQDYRFFDLNNDGYPDMLWSIRPGLQGGVLETGSIHIVLGDASMNYAGKEEIVIDGYGMRNLPSEDNRLYDMDNNGWLDLPVTATDGFTTAFDGTTHLQTADGTLYFYPNWETVFEREQSPSFTGDIKYGNNHPPFADLNGDGSPDGGDGYGGILMRTKHTNEAPAAPTNVRAMQQVSTVLLQWDAATDAETPAAHMRYNVSLKRKGATGADSYILSPLNEGQRRGGGHPRLSVPHRHPHGSARLALHRGRGIRTTRAGHRLVERAFALLADLHLPHGKPGGHRCPGGDLHGAAGHRHLPGHGERHAPMGSGRRRRSAGSHRATRPAWPGARRV